MSTFIQEVLSLLDRHKEKKQLQLKNDYFEFGRKSSAKLSPSYNPKMDPYVIKFEDLKCNIIKGLVAGTGTQYTLPMWSTLDSTNCNVQTIIDSIYSQNPTATQGTVTGDFNVTGDTVLNGNLLVLGTQTIIESTIVQIADNIFQINSGGAGINAGIEVVQPSGTYSILWDTLNSVWTLGNESLTLQNINVNGTINIDGESISNITNEAEGLNAEDNDNSLPTTAAVKDYVDNVKLTVVGDVGSEQVTLFSEQLEILGGVNINTAAQSNDILLVSLDDDIFLNSVTANTINILNNFTLAGEDISNITNSTEGLLAENTDNSIPTTAAVVTYVDAVDLEVSADAGTPLSINLLTDTFQVRGGTNTNTFVDGNQRVIVNLDNDITINSVTSNYLTLTGAPAPYQVTSIVNNEGQTVDYNTTLLTAKAVLDYINTQRDYVSNVQLTGTNLVFTGIGNAFSSSVNLSSLDNTYTASNGVLLNGNNIELDNLQKEITTDYTLTDADNNYTIFINNGSNAVNVRVPANLVANFNAGFIQEGSGLVTFVPLGVTNINTPTGYAIQGQNYQAYIEKKLNTTTYYLLGNIV